jgi:LL-diaminopimelate aminotransferase
LDALPPYLFAALARRSEGKRAEGVDVINLGSGDPDTPTAPGVLEAAHKALEDPLNHRYPQNRGKPSFRKAAADFMQARYGVALDPETEIAPALGGKEAVHHLGLVALNPGDICLCPDPAYPVYRTAAHIAGAECHVMPLLEANGFIPDFDALPDVVRQRANLLYVNYPNNPTGAVARSEDFARIVRFAQANDIIVVHDNAYSEIAFDSVRVHSFLETPGAREVGVEIFSLSKGWNMTGWRLAFIAGSAEVIAKYLHLKPNIDAGPFGALQDAAAHALVQCRDFPVAMSRVYQRRRDLMTAALDRIGFRTFPSVATLFLWARIPQGWTSPQAADTIFNQAGVVVSPGSAFGECGQGYIRVALTAPAERLAEAAKRIAEIRDFHPGADAPSLQGRRQTGPELIDRNQIR